MALIKDFEIPDTGLVIKDAYHVITKVDTEKRLNDIAPPPDSSTSTGYTHRNNSDESQWVYWKAGYIGRISIEIYTTKQAREEGKKPIGAICINPTDVQVNGSLTTDIKDFDLRFFIDPTSQSSIIDQAYQHLLMLDFYKGAIPD
jgi:hypothetical protein